MDEQILTIQEIEEGIRKDFYGVDVLRFKARAAYAIKRIKDKATRERLTQMFSGTNSGRDVNVWSRIVERFPGALDNSILICADGLLAVSYLCQLPLALSLKLFVERIDQLNEPNVHLWVLQAVNEARPTRNRAAPKPKPCATCARVREIVEDYDVVRAGAMRPSAQHGAMIEDLRAALDGAGEVEK
jgi:hypothetical protein